MTHLVRRFSQRASLMRNRLDLPLTPVSSAGSKVSHPVEISINTDPIVELKKSRPEQWWQYLNFSTFCCGGRPDDVLDPQGYYTLDKIV